MGIMVHAGLHMHLLMLLAYRRCGCKYTYVAECTYVRRARGTRSKWPLPFWCAVKGLRRRAVCACILDVSPIANELFRFIDLFRWLRWLAALPEKSSTQLATAESHGHRLFSRTRPKKSQIPDDNETFRTSSRSIPNISLYVCSLSLVAHVCLNFYFASSHPYSNGSHFSSYQCRRSFCLLAHPHLYANRYDSEF